MPYRTLHSNNKQHAELSGTEERKKNKTIKLICIIYSLVVNHMKCPSLADEKKRKVNEARKSR